MLADPRLDRLVEFDEQSRNFPIRTLLEAKQPRGYTWSCKTVLDQRNEGACVGFSVAHEIAARPKVSIANAALAHRIYVRARELDEWPGEDYEGTSVLGGMKAALEAGYFGEYRWAFGLDDLVLALGYKGPAVLGVVWRRGMMEPDSAGYLHNHGDILGGHAILARGVSVKKQYVLLHNSWGPDWGNNGTAKVSFDDLEALLDDDGEACIPVQRYVVK
ncbi:hypothetical protein [Caudovirales GX15bay]|nr:hypothetical protein [Caudovirales GX15bay]